MLKKFKHIVNWRIKESLRSLHEERKREVQLFEKILYRNLYDILGEKIIIKLRW